MHLKQRTKRLTSSGKEIKKLSTNNNQSKTCNQEIMVPKSKKANTAKRANLTYIDTGLNELIEKKLKYYLNNFIQ